MEFCEIDAQRAYCSSNDPDPALGLVSEGVDENKGSFAREALCVNEWRCFGETVPVCEVFK